MTDGIARDNAFYELAHGKRPYAKVSSTSKLAASRVAGSMRPTQIFPNFLKFSKPLNCPGPMMLKETDMVSSGRAPSLRLPWRAPAHSLDPSRPRAGRATDGFCRQPRACGLSQRG